MRIPAQDSAPSWRGNQKNTLNERSILLSLKLPAVHFAPRRGRLGFLRLRSCPSRVCAPGGRAIPGGSNSRGHVARSAPDPSLGILLPVLRSRMPRGEAPGISLELLTRSRVHIPRPNTAPRPPTENPFSYPQLWINCAQNTNNPHNH